MLGVVLSVDLLVRHKKNLFDVYQCYYVYTHDRCGRASFRFLLNPIIACNRICSMLDNNPLSLSSPSQIHCGLQVFEPRITIVIWTYVVLRNGLALRGESHR